MAYGFLSQICFSANRVIFYLGHGQFCSELPRCRWTMSSLLCYLEKSGHKFLSSLLCYLEKSGHKFLSCLLCYLEKSGHKFFVLHDFWTLYNKIISRKCHMKWCRKWLSEYQSVICQSYMYFTWQCHTQIWSIQSAKFRTKEISAVNCVDDKKNLSFMITNKSRNKLHYWFLSAV